MYSFNNWGWYSPTLIPDRTTDIAPPSISDAIVGELYPNFTGYAWVMIPYTDPLALPIPEPVVEPIPEPTPIIVPVPIIIVVNKTITKYQLLARFTQEERIALYTEENNNITIKVWLEMFRAAQNIDLKDQTTIDGVTALETAGIIAAGRAAEILTY